MKKLDFHHIGYILKKPIYIQTSDRQKVDLARRVLDKLRLNK